jgi:quinoprotein dehydrogenase-associated probable ABC transporter substrate-binding protein
MFCEIKWPDGCATLAMLAAILLVAPEPVSSTQAPSPLILRVCADPNNLPFSNRRREGFENQIAALVARELGTNLTYVWWPQRRGFVRQTVNQGRCDLVIGVPAAYKLLLTTRAYYRSTYVFVSRADAPARVHSFDDSALRRLRIGVHFTGGGGGPPPAQALARRGLSSNIRGYSIFGDYREPHPPGRLVAAVAAREVDVAVVWGPIAGYFARRSSVPLRVRRVEPPIDSPAEPMTFAIAMGVSRGDTALRDRVQHVLDRRAGRLKRLLERFGVPLLPLESVPVP